MSNVENLPEKKWALWTRNVADRFKDMSNEDISRELRSTAIPLSIFIANVEQDFNIGSIIRTANAMNVREIFYYGKKHWDRRGAVGTHNYMSINFVQDYEAARSLSERYNFVALENTGGTQKMFDFSWPENTMLVIGEESNGVPAEVLDLCNHKVEIPQYGSVRSLNAAVAASIGMYDFMTKFRKNSDV